MSALKVRRIELAANNAAAQIQKLRDQFRIDSEIVSAASKKLTVAVFGKPMIPVEAVERICLDVRDNGLEAVLKYTEHFDKVKLKPNMIRVEQGELEAAHAKAAPEFLETLRRIRRNINSFQSGLLHRDAELRVSGGYDLQQRYRAFNRVGVYCPGGAAAYPSTLLMTVCPAQAAGVKEIVVVMPPTPTGAYSPDMLATCHELGVTEVYRIGGAQAIAALAYGVEGIPAVNMIVGPGNQYVALAKKFVYGVVAIDCIAGPSEVVVVADDSAHPNYLALDLLAQAEHNPGTAVLLTWYEPLLAEVMEALESAWRSSAAATRRGTAWSVTGRSSSRRTSTRPSTASTSWPRNTCTSRRATPRRSPTKSRTPGRSSWGRSPPSHSATTPPGRATCCRPAAPRASAAA